MKQQMNEVVQYHRGVHGLVGYVLGEGLLENFVDQSPHLMTGAKVEEV
jgi:hypothetical protein